MPVSLPTPLETPPPLDRLSLARPIAARDLADADRTGTRPALAIVLAYLAANILYGFLSPAPWDDDCIGRYFNTVKAWHDPAQFFDVWNRPLYVFLFAPAVLLGRSAAMLQMVLICAAAGWALFLAVRRWGAPNAWMVLPFFFFQSYFFTISRNNLTEPLAAALICFGLYALVHRRFLLFAIMGSLLPLARLELVVVMPLWAFVLMREKQWRYLIVLAVPCLLLTIGGHFVLHKDLFWLAKDTVGAEHATNRYGHTDLWHYFQRFGFVVGPVVFLFFTVGVAERVSRWRLDVFLAAQSAVVFGLYVLFSWKLNMGNAAGFLRNLIPLTPFIALFALDGLNAWAEAWQRPEMLRPEETDEAPVQGAKGRKGQVVRMAASRRKVEEAEARSARLARTHQWLLARVVGASLLALWISHHYYSWVLRSHHKITTEPTYTAESITLGLVMLLLTMALLSWRRVLPRWSAPALFGVVVLAAPAFTLASERPDAHMNPERHTLMEISALFRDGHMQDAPLYVNHLWFFWPYDLGYPDARYRRLTKAEVDAAPPHARFIWENHYSDRLGADVQLNDLVRRPDLVELCRAMSPDQAFMAALFQKVDPALKDGPALSDAFIRENPKIPYGYCSRALRESTAHQNGPLHADITAMLALDSTSLYAHRVAASSYMNAGEIPEALREYLVVVRLDSNFALGYQELGFCVQRSGDTKGALGWFKKALVKDPKLVQAQESIALCHYLLKDYDKAMAAYNATIRLAPREASAYMGIGNCLYQREKYKEALAYFDASLKVQPRQGAVFQNKGLCLVKLGRTAEACAPFQQAVALGTATAASLVKTYCH